jgi:membrane associated rhomboid family serine protease
LLPIRDVNPTRIRPLLTWLLIAANAAIFFPVQPSDEIESIEFTYRNAAIACELTTGDPLELREIDGPCIEERIDAPIFPETNVWFSVVASMFLHGGLAHIAFNMWSLWIFGNNVEEAFGHGGYAGLYLGAGVAATAGFVLVNPDLTVPLVGASGAIAGVMGAYLVLFPRHLVMTLVLFRIVAIPAVLFLGIWFFSQFLLSSDAGAIAWEAHVAGFLFGVVVTLPLRSRLLENTLEGSRREADVFGF